MTQTATRRRFIRRPEHFSDPPVPNDSTHPVPHIPRPRRPKALIGKGHFRYFMDRSGRQHFNFVQRIWLDPAGRIDIVYDDDGLAILFPSGHIPDDIERMMPASALEEDDEPEP